MRPSLYADDLGLVLPEALSDESVARLSEFLLKLEGLQRVLPRRCPDCHGLGYENYLADTEWPDGMLTQEPDQRSHPPCEGRGWLYPDPPDWWERSSSGRVWIRQWEQHCRTSWRAMCILGDDSTT